MEEPSRAVYTFSMIGGGAWPDRTWGYASATWPFVRLRVGASGVKWEPSFIRNLVVFSIPTWEASWSEVRRAEVNGDNVTFHALDGKRWSFYTLGRRGSLIQQLRLHPVELV